MVKQMPIEFSKAGKSDVRSQFAALCYRVVDKKHQILLVTARNSGRWIIPKGWPMNGKTPADAALREAWEEAGVLGKASAQIVGLYSYSKQTGDGNLPCVGLVFPIRVKSLARKYPERNQRKRKWFSPKKAAQKVTDPELARILLKFDPKRLH